MILYYSQRWIPSIKYTDCIFSENVLIMHYNCAEKSYSSRSWIVTCFHLLPREKRNNIVDTLEIL